MKHKNKPVTKALIRKYFGKDAKIRGFAGRYRVTTRSGGEVIIAGRNIKTIYGGDDVYRAVIQLSGECWGGMTIRGGSREFMLASMAHGEAWGVNVRPSFENRGTTFLRWCIAVAVFFFGYGQILPQTSSPLEAALIAALAAFMVFRFLRRVARQREQRKLETSGFTYPRETTGAAYADDEQLRKAGLI